MRDNIVTLQQLFKLLEMLSLNESSEREPNLACLATTILSAEVIPTALTLTAIKNVTLSASWKARNAIL